MVRTPTTRLTLLGLSLLSGCAAHGVETASMPRTVAETAYGDYLIGRFAQDTNNPGVAATNLLRALARDPNNPALINQTFAATLMDGRPEAVQLARSLPDNPLAILLLGNTAAQRGDWLVAQGQFARLTESGLPQFISPLLIAWARQGAADTAGALATLQPDLKKPLLGSLYTLHAALIADLGDRFPQAQPLYASAGGGAGGTNLRLARIVANWQYRQGHEQDARATLQGLARTSPALQLVLPGLLADLSARPVRNAVDGLAEVYLSFAAELRQQNGAETAMALLRLALNLRPDLTAAKLLLADTLQAQKQGANALRVLATIGNQDPLAPLVRLRRANIEADAGDTATAEAGLRQLAASLPDRPEPLAALADIQRGHGQKEQAIATYGQAIGRAPANTPGLWPMFFARAVVEHDVGDWPRSEADLRQALALAPDQPEVLNFLGYAWADRNEHLAEAHTMLARAAQLRPNDGAIIDSLGWVMLRQGDVAGAVTSLERAAQIEPEDPEINGHLGDAYWAAGRTLQARYQWQLALNLKPAADAVPKLQAKLQDAARAGR